MEYPFHPPFRSELEREIMETMVVECSDEDVQRRGLQTLYTQLQLHPAHTCVGVWLSLEDDTSRYSRRLSEPTLTCPSGYWDMMGYLLREKVRIHRNGCPRYLVERRYLRAGISILGRCSGEGPIGEEG